jgi:hypothetical protein
MEVRNAMTFTIADKSASWYACSISAGLKMTHAAPRTARGRYAEYLRFGGCRAPRAQEIHR